MKHQETAAKPTVLIVDDQPANIQALGNLLREDYQVLVAAGGTLTTKNEEPGTLNSQLL